MNGFGANCNEFSRLVLGTTQLGMNYGIANKTGKPDIQMTKDIIYSAWESGIWHFDTAQTYGNSEKILGETLADLGITNQARIVTKPDPNIDHTNKKDLEDALKQSIENLKLDRLYCMMLHREAFLDLFSSGLADTLEKFLVQGLVEKIGISLYTPARAKTALETNLISILQLPANICDHRFYEAGIFDLARERETEIHVRSVFLQGLLLMDRRKLSAKMQYAMPIIEETEKLCKEFNISKQELALCYIKQKYPGVFVIIGMETKKQLADNLSTWKSNQLKSITARVDSVFSKVNETIINPTLWP